jgi:hypothetical protein
VSIREKTEVDTSGILLDFREGVGLSVLSPLRPRLGPTSRVCAVTPVSEALYLGGNESGKSTEE